MRLQVIVAVVLAALVASCGGSKSPTAPTTPTTATRVISLTGNMDFGAIQVGASFSATLTIHNSGNSALTITGLTASSGVSSVIKASWTSGSVPAGGWQDVLITFSPLAVQSYSGAITVNGDQTSGNNTIAFSGSGSLQGVPIFTMRGVGDSVFTVPSYVTRLRIDATYGGYCQNFIVHISTQVTSLVNIIIGTCPVADTRSPFSGTYAINNGGDVSIINSTGVSWTFTEVR